MAALARKAWISSRPESLDILNFWYGPNGLTPDGKTLNDPSLQSNWFKKSDDFDNQIKEKFQPLLEKIDPSVPFSAEGSSTPHDFLATIILTDQFTRNMFRGSGKMFFWDPYAQQITKHIIQNNLNKEFGPLETMFLLLPLMHAEDKKISQEAMDLYQKFGDEGVLSQNVVNFMKSHYAIVQQFGRYPHRNQLLGRDTTPEETEFMKHHTGF